MSVPKAPEPWLRGTGGELPAIPRAVVHALELASEDIDRWCGGLTDEEINARPVDSHLSHFTCGISLGASTTCSPMRRGALSTSGKWPG